MDGNRVIVEDPEGLFAIIEDRVLNGFRVLDLIDCYPQQSVSGTEKNLRRLIRKMILDAGNDVLDLLKEGLGLS